MSNWNLPTLQSLYTDFLAFLKGRDDDAVRLNDSRTTAATNLPDYAKRWNATLGTFQNWLSSAWGNLVISIAGGGTGAADAATARTNLDVFSKGEGDGRYETPSGSTAKVATHAALTDAHGATSGPTASRIVMRDSNGQAAIAAPTSSNHIAIKQTVDDHATLETAHGATSENIGLRIVLRDGGGRFKASVPILQDQVANKGFVEGLLVSGTYTPTLTYLANMTSAIARICKYIKIGNIVHVFGEIYFTQTTLGLETGIGISLPVASDFTTPYQCSGVANTYYGTMPMPGTVKANTTSNIAELRFANSNVTTGSIFFSFGYEVV